MATPSYLRPLGCAAKRLKLSPPVTASIVQARHESTQAQPLPPNIKDELSKIRLPRAVQATYLQPLKRRRPSQGHSHAVCDLQLRSYSVRNLEVFADFALRAAYYLNLPASGPVPLPQIVERWTVPRSVFIFKKSMENFERKTLRRAIQIQDGHPETVAIWLAFLKKYQYYGVGMKANVYDHSGLDVVKDMDAEAGRVADKLGETLELFGGREDVMKGEQEVGRQVHQEVFKGQWGGMGPMGASGSVENASKRIADHFVNDGKR